MMRKVCGALLPLFLWGCSSGSSPNTKEGKVGGTTLTMPEDETRRFPSEDRVSTSVVPEHLIDPSLDPGGTKGDYRNGQGAYEVDLVHTSNNEKAAFLLLDIKKLLTSPKYLPNMGGYFGSKEGKPFYTFAKGAYLVCIKGIPEQQADVFARTFAARLP
jgi:hypothetical protein